MSDYTVQRLRAWAEQLNRESAGQGEHLLHYVSAWEETERELAEARAALAEVDSEFDADDDRWWEYWKTRHAAALKAARERS